MIVDEIRAISRHGHTIRCVISATRPSTMIIGGCDQLYEPTEKAVRDTVHFQLIKTQAALNPLQADLVAAVGVGENVADGGESLIVCFD